MAKRQKPKCSAKMKRCIAKVKAKGKANPYAVCKRSVGK